MAQTESADAGGDAELGLDNVGGVFVVLTSGMVIATLVAVCEFSWKARKLAHKGGNVTRAIRSELDAAFRFSSFLYSFLFFFGVLLTTSVFVVVVFRATRNRLDRPIENQRGRR